MTKKLTVVQMLPELVSGGVERGTLEMGKYLVDHGHRSIVISAGGPMVEQLVREGSEHVEWAVGKKTLSTIRYIKKVRNLLRETKPDILHLRSRLPAWIGYFAWKKLPSHDRPKLVTTVHGCNSVSRYSAIMVKGEKVIAVSEMVRGYILENYPAVDQSQIEVIHRGVDKNEYTFGYAPSESWKQKWYRENPQMQGKQILVLPGRITRLKGHAEFINIIHQLVSQGKNVHGVIVGGTHRSKRQYEEELVKQIVDLDLTHDITFVGHRTDVKEIFAISTVVFSLSMKPESFGRTTLEALSLGTPVVGYSHGGVKEQLEALLPQGAVPVGDLSGVVHKIQEWNTSLPVPEANTTFTLDAMCSSILRVYTEPSLDEI